MNTNTLIDKLKAAKVQHPWGDYVELETAINIVMGGSSAVHHDLCDRDSSGTLLLEESPASESLIEKLEARRIYFSGDGLVAERAANAMLDACITIVRNASDHFGDVTEMVSSEIPDTKIKKAADYLWRKIQLGESGVSRDMIARELREVLNSYEVLDVEVNNLLHLMNLDRPDIAALPQGATIAINVTTHRQAADLIKRLASNLQKAAGSKP